MLRVWMNKNMMKVSTSSGLKAGEVKIFVVAGCETEVKQGTKSTSE